MSDITALTLSRRELLRLGAAAIVAPDVFAPHRAQAWRFTVCSDTHFGVPDALETNRALFAEMARHSPQLAIIAGDVTERAWQAEYDDLDRATAGLPFPVHGAPGNHDVRWAPLGLQAFSTRVGPPHRVIMHDGLAFILLDSTVPLSHWGHIGGPQRRWLAGELERIGVDTPVFVFLHHPTGRDPVAVSDQDALLDVLAPYNLKVMFTGHGHSDLIWQWRGVTHTMSKGLYQGSYQLAEVDVEAGEVRLSRRTAEQPEPVQFATVLLARDARLVSPADALGIRSRAPSRGLREVWRQPLGGGVLSHLLLHDGTLYVSAMDGSVSAFDPRDGTLRWRARTGDYCHSSPVVAGDALVVGSADGGIYCFAVDDGALRWRVATEGPVYASAAIARGIAAMASGDGSVYGIGMDDGEVRWRWRMPPSETSFAQSPAATDAERVYIGAWDRHVYALDLATGRERWRYLATQRGFYYSPAIGAPALRNGRLYVPSNENTLHCLDTATGEAVWTVHSPGDRYGYSSPVLDGDRIYLGCIGENGEVRCLNAADGSEVWASATGSEIYDSSPAIAGDTLAIGSVDGTLWILRKTDGAIVGEYRFPPGHFLSTPAAEQGRVYAATLAEVLLALDPTA